MLANKFYFTTKKIITFFFLYTVFLLLMIFYQQMQINYKKNILCSYFFTINKKKYLYLKDIRDYEIFVGVLYNSIIVKKYFRTSILKGILIYDKKNKLKKNSREFYDYHTMTSLKKLCYSAPIAFRDFFYFLIFINNNYILYNISKVLMTVLFSFEFTDACICHLDKKGHYKNMLDIIMILS